MPQALRRRGFTLLELLVVIAIIAVLVGLLFPVYEQCMKKAESTSCLSNVHSLVMAAMLYADDSDNMLPPALIPSQPAGYAICWDLLLKPYLCSNPVYLCPADQACSPGPSWTYSLPHSYGVNLNLTAVGGYMGVAYDRERISHPAETVLFFELNQVNGYGWEPDWGDAAAYIAQRHLSGGNFAFCAGNVRWMKTQDTLAGAGMWAP